MSNYHRVLIIVFMALILTGGTAWAEPRPPKDITIIATGNTPETIYLGKNTNELDQLGFDGVGTWIASSGARQEGVGSMVSVGERFNEQFLKPNGGMMLDPNGLIAPAADMQPTKNNTFKKNYLRLTFSNYGGTMNWFDDTWWSRASYNAQQMAHFASESGMKGFTLDAEPYNDRLFHYDDLVANDPGLYGSKTFADVRAKVRQRGREFIQAVNSELPDASMFMYHGYWAITDFHGITSVSQLPHSSYGLWGAFIDGMLEASTANTTFVDGSQNGAGGSNWWVHAPRSAFESTRQKVLYDPITLGLTEVPTEYAEKIRLGFGMYTTENQETWSQTNPQANWVTPQQLQNALEIALDVGDGYVWFWNERVNFFLPAIDGASYNPNDVGVHPDYLAAIKAAKAPYVGPGLKLVKADDPQGNTPEHYTSYDLIATTDENLAIMELVVQGDGPGSIYQHPFGSVYPEPIPDLITTGVPPTLPPQPELEFDTYITLGAWDYPTPTNIIGPAVDIDPGSVLTFNDEAINIAWAASGGSSSGPGEFQVARITLRNGSSISYQALGWETDLSPATTLENSFDVPASQMSLVMVEAQDPEENTPDGYTTYDFIAMVDTNTGLMQLILDTDNSGDIYQDSLGSNLAPNPAFFEAFPALEFDSYVTMPVTHSIVGSAVDIDPGSPFVFDDQNLNVAWASSGGANSGYGIFQIARITLKDTATGSWTLMGWQTGGFEAVTVTGGIPGSLIPGDVNGDGFVGGDDLSMVMSNWGIAGAIRSQGDLDGDGFVGGSDYSEVLGYWGTGTPPEAVPEPATLALLLLGGLALLRRRR